MREWSAPSPPPRWSTSDQPPFVARREEFAALETAWADAVAGAGRAVFISGEPGAGKSRLVGEVCTHLHADGAAVLFGSCIQELGAPLDPFDEPIRELLPVFRGGDSPLADSVTLLDGVIGRSTDGGTAPLIGQDRLYDAVIDVVQAAAEMHPLVLVLDDLHWADPTAIGLLTRLVERSAAAPILILGTLRDVPPDRSDPLTDALARLRHLDGVARLELEPFTTDEIVDYVGRRNGLSGPHARASAEVIRQLTGGNAFLVRETWRRVVEAEHQGGMRVITMPDTTREILRPRFATLEPRHLAVLEVAAVLGLEFDLAEILAISEVPEEVTLAAIDAAAMVGLLEVPRAPEEPHRFPHTIARQAVVDQVSGARLLGLHARIAQTLEADFPTAQLLVQRLAHHFAAARALGFGDRAVTYLTKSAEIASRLIAHEDAARLFERAAEIAGDPDERDLLTLRAARSWVATADFARARELCELVIERGGARISLEAAIGHEDASWRPGLQGHRSVELLRSALESVPNDEGDPLYVLGLSSLARAMAFTGSTDDAERLGDRAINLARRLDDQKLLALTLRTSLAPNRPRAAADRLARSAELVARARPLHDDLYIGSLYLRSGACYVAGDRIGMDEAERGLIEESRQLGAYWRYWVESARLGRVFIEGRLGDAEVSCRRIRDAEAVFKSDSTSGANALQSYMVRRESGRLDSIRHLVTGEESPTSRWAPGLLALYTELEMAEPARRVLGWLLDHDDALAHASSNWPARLVFMVEAALWLRDADIATALRPWMEEYSRLNLMSGYFVAVFGAADRYLGEIDSLCATDGALELLEAALVLDENTGADLHVAQTLAAMAVHLRGQPSASRRAEQLADRARGLAEPAGMERVLRSLNREFSPDAGIPSGGMSPRELEVIRLIAEGRSNREIAGHLVISEHTAANHVRSILTKIGATNRTQAAMYAHDRGLLRQEGQ
ncbi:AAA family ATPase [Leifsonia sp. YIM 134122]|uniref:AAA family ATPase n=1 Tax=Leifsonia stereocauli TaxID=3134136 RepID=A0ABU9W7I8_9MICO